MRGHASVSCYNGDMPVHPAAWYRDPHDPGRVRRWDGGAWTGEVRAVPDWLRTFALAEGPGRRAPYRSRRLWTISALLLFAGAAIGVAVRPNVPDPDRIDDPTFVAAANGVCRSLGLREAPMGEARLAGTAWDEVADEIDNLVPRPLNQPAVDRWVGGWRDLAATARAFADASDSQTRQLTTTEAVRVALSVNRFSYVNGLNDCRAQLYGRPR